MTIKIGTKKIGKDQRPFIIAEMSGNHNQSLDRALKIVEAAKQCGCDAIKLQTFTANTLTMNSKRKEFLVSNKKNLWKGFTLYDLYKKASMPWDWHKIIFKKCKELNLIAFSTCFDESSVDFLDSLDVPAYKIASFENIHHPLLKKVAATGKPILMSTGMATLKELEESVNIIRESGCNDIILLKCTSSYPAKPKYANLKTIPHLAQHFDCEVGLSDHTLGIDVSIASIALGARIIEKHFTLDRSDGGVDASFSIEPSEMKQLVDQAKKTFAALGKVQYGPTLNEKNNLQYRPSIYTVKDIQAGEKFTKNKIKIIRPGNGLAPKHYESILGTKALRTINKGTPLKLNHISNHGNG